MVEAGGMGDSISIAARAGVASVVALVAWGVVAKVTDSTAANAPAVHAAVPPKATGAVKNPKISDAEMLAAVRARFDAIDPALLKGAAIEIEQYRFSCILDRDPGPAVSEAIARGFVNQGIKVLMEKGIDPQKEWIYLSSYVYRRGPPSPTGKETVIQLGKANYSFADDRIEFDRSW